MGVAGIKGNSAGAGLLGGAADDEGMKADKAGEAGTLRAAPTELLIRTASSCFCKLTTRSEISSSSSVFFSPALKDETDWSEITLCVYASTAAPPNKSVLF
jgi:hypothetical protein